MEPYTAPAFERPRARIPVSESPLAARARALWPRLERSSLSRCGGDAHCIAARVSRRTSLPQEAILRLLTGEDS
jgi:hypothetical protein